MYVYLIHIYTYKYIYHMYISHYSRSIPSGSRVPHFKQEEEVSVQCVIGQIVEKLGDMGWVLSG